ncbi:MAG: glycosyltransferase family 2 protein [Halioglobus sp.]
MSSDSFSVIVPAFNEETVIERTLDALLGEPGSAGFEVIVVCNGCSDETAFTVRSSFPEVRVLEIDEASKTAAINEGLSLAKPGPVLLLDADIELDTDSARALIAAASQPGIDTAIGHMSVDTAGADTVVRAFYRVWMEHPYLRNGKFAAAIALSTTGRTRIGRLPAVTADDTYLRRIVPSDRVAVVPSVSFRVRAPLSTSSLLQVRSRSYRGNRELSAHTQAQVQTKEARGLIQNLSRKPSLWLYVPIYLVVALSAKALSYYNSGVRWERDLTTRMKTAE